MVWPEHTVLRPERMRAGQSTRALARAHDIVFWPEHMCCGRSRGCRHGRAAATVAVAAAAAAAAAVFCRPWPRPQLRPQPRPWPLQVCTIIPEKPLIEIGCLFLLLRGYLM